MKKTTKYNWSPGTVLQKDKGWCLSCVYDPSPRPFMVSPPSGTSKFFRTVRGAVRAFNNGLKKSILSVFVVSLVMQPYRAPAPATPLAVGITVVTCGLAGYGAYRCVKVLLVGRKTWKCVVHFQDGQVLSREARQISRAELEKLNLAADPGESWAVTSPNYATKEGAERYCLPGSGNKARETVPTLWKSTDLKTWELAGNFALYDEEICLTLELDEKEPAMFFKVVE